MTTHEHHEHEHHCDDPHCHDPHCDGEHEHHGHEHEHHCDDPNCHDPHCNGEHEHAHHEHGHHDHVHEGPEHAAIFAAQRSFTPAAPVAREALEDAALAVFRDVGEAYCIDGILPGHAKGLVASGDDAFSLSLTCADQIDTGLLGCWASLKTVAAFTVTINVHLLVPHALDEDALFAPFAAL